jgi:hypothetical protein
MNRSKELIACLEGEIVRRDIRIAELESGVVGENRELELLTAYCDQLRTELAAVRESLREQVPAAYEVSSYGGRVNNIVMREDVAIEQADRRISEGAHDVRVRPLYAAPVAKPQGVMPEWLKHEYPMATRLEQAGWQPFHDAQWAGAEKLRLEILALLAAAPAPGDSQ